MNSSLHNSFAAVICITLATSAFSGDFHTDVKPLLTKYCITCHSGEDANGDVDFESIISTQDVNSAFETWEAVVEHLNARTMPPEDELQPSNEERSRVTAWYQHFVNSVESRPAVFRPRRLSVTEYRNTLRSLFGFDLEVAVIEAEQTLTERSLVVKLLPTDPPGKSGFRNDTHENPLTTLVWDQYIYLVESALEQLFSPERRTQLEILAGPVEEGVFTDPNADRLIRTFLRRSRRRAVTESDVEKIISAVRGKAGDNLIDAVKFEIKTMLMSPQFMYRGLLLEKNDDADAGRQPVDRFELAERLSYFLWADMPDEQLLTLAESGQLSSPEILNREIDRMLASPKARSLSEVFATEWLTLNEIEQVSNNPPVMLALKTQPLDFMHYLFTEDRPLLELIKSDVTFINPHTQRMYGRDAKQMTRYIKQKGIEVEAVSNQKIQLQETKERGGILTMPGILAMNRGPILRGTWMLERILGEELPEPPPDVGQVPPNSGKTKLTFRQRFEQHRSNAACAVCHDKIDPLGFALQDYDNSGQYLRSKNYRAPKKRKKDTKTTEPSSEIDTSGKLPSGETFDNITGLREILTTSQRDVVIRNIVKRTMSYALCRKLTIYDHPTVESITKQMSQSGGTWRDLFQAIVQSVPFRETIISGAESP